MFYGGVVRDGYINKRGILTIEHSLGRKDSLFCKYKIMKSFGWLTDECQPKITKQFDSRTDKRSNGLRFYTKTLFIKQLNFFYSQQSHDKWIKRLPESWTI